VVPNTVRKQSYEFFLSNAFGFGGTNCCVVFKGV
jgi:3-oxoacyl-[acyl-carrier-protein] synthase II